MAVPADMVTAGSYDTDTSTLTSSYEIAEVALTNTAVLQCETAFGTSETVSQTISLYVVGKWGQVESLQPCE